MCGVTCKKMSASCLKGGLQLNIILIIPVMKISGHAQNILVKRDNSEDIKKSTHGNHCRCCTFYFSGNIMNITHG